jgi:hypothetical protein
MAEIIDIGISKLDDEPIKLDISNPSPTPSQKSVNFGPGVDMLMNTRSKSSNSNRTNGIQLNDSNEINIDDLNKLESELNDLSEPSSRTDNIFSKPFISLNKETIETPLPTINKSFNEPIPIKLNTVDNIGDPNLGKASTSSNNKETWDGYKYFNEIPVDPNADTEPKEKPMSREELLKTKKKFLYKLEKLKEKGVQVSKHYTMDSSLDEIQGEYEMIISEKEKSNSVKFQGKIMMGCITALEYLNDKFDPFDLKLDGWGESISENIDEYDDIFAELHEKYSSKAKMAPELKLLFQLGGSAVMLHMTNTMFKSAMPGMDDIMRQNPDLMKQFTQAAASSMGQTNPGFGNFMGGLMGGGSGNQQQSQQSQQQSQQGFYGNNTGRESVPSVMRQPPQTQQQRPDIAPGPSNRPDIGMSRNQPIFNDAENMEDRYGNFSQQEEGQRQMPFQSQRQPTQTTQSTQQENRPEMRGPRDISDVLKKLKSKPTPQINQSPQQNIPTRNINSFHKMESGSTISIDELKSISKDADGYPNKSKRKPRSERNTVSLDI